MKTRSLLRINQGFLSLSGSCLLSLCLSANVFAEPAPVYDVESMPPPQATESMAQASPPTTPQQQMSQQQMPMQLADAENNQPDVMPPPMPGDEENTFVPMQQQNANKDPVQPRSSQPQDIAAEPVTIAQSPHLPIDERIKRIEQQITNIQATESISRVESLQNQVQTLRGQFEQLNHQLSQIQTQQKAMYTDIDKRLGQQLAQANTGNKSLPVVEPLTTPTDAAVTTSAKVAPKPMPVLAKAMAKTITPAGPSNQAPNHQPNVAEEQQIYQTAYTLIKSKKYAEAVNTLQNMLHKYPTGQFASNAHYWLGELYGVMGKNDQALNEFGVVVNSYPDSPRVSDAQLKVGLIYAAQLKWSDAKIAFKKVINHYPGTTSSRLASEQLKQIKQAGH